MMNATFLRACCTQCQHCYDYEHKVPPEHVCPQCGHTVSFKQTAALGSREYWLALVTADMLADYDETTIDLAINRLMHKDDNGWDVTFTRYGWRVACRPDLGDDRAVGTAYWPNKQGGCRCRSYKSRGTCSHALAVLLEQRGIDTEDRF
jgi:hypothetical protein